MTDQPQTGEPGKEPGLSELRARLQEAEDTLDAIRNGDVDAVVVGGSTGQKVYTLQNADRPYRVLIEQMQEGALTLSDDGTVLYCNQRFAALVMLPRETIIGHGIHRFLSVNEHEAFTELLVQGKDTGASGEFILRVGGGVEVPVNVSLIDLKVEEGISRVICCVVTDLTHARRRSHELAAANERLASEIEERRRAEDSLRLALDAAGMGSWDFDLYTGTAQRSLRHDRIFGYAQPLPVWTLQTTLGHVDEADRDKVASSFAQAERSGTIEFEARIRRAGDGVLCWVHFKGQTFYDSGRPRRIAGVVTDVTQRRMVEEQLRQAQKMEAIGQLTGGIAHDFNNLLMIIGGSLDMLGRHLGRPGGGQGNAGDRVQRLIDAARQGVARGAKLNQQLLAFSRRQDLRAEVVCVDELLPGFEHLLNHAIGEAVRVRIASSPDLWACRTDPMQLETAILNLAINARDAMPQGGTLTLSLENRTVTSQAAAPWSADGGDYVVVAVGDTGTGMPPEVAARVFEPFFTTKEMGKGTGLGLSQVYGFAKQSDGFVTIDSKLGEGTTVAIHLPRTEIARTRAAPAMTPVTATAKGHSTVLLVEDDADVRATAGGMLRDLGYKVREADTARKALTLLDDVDLVFSDVIMPEGMNGIELARELRTRRPGLPVLLTSGYTAQRVIPETREVLHVLRKPYSLAELAHAVQATIGGGHGV
jgi:PAS domain S-box-containing protein